jgi:hypothetical protein
MDIDFNKTLEKIQAFEGHHGPELINRFFDVLTVQKSTVLIVIDGVSVLLQTLLGMILLAFYHLLQDSSNDAADQFDGSYRKTFRKFSTSCENRVILSPSGNSIVLQE